MDVKVVVGVSVVVVGASEDVKVVIGVSVVVVGASVDVKVVVGVSVVVVGASVDVPGAVDVPGVDSVSVEVSVVVVAEILIYFNIKFPVVQERSSRPSFPESCWAQSVANPSYSTTYLSIDIVDNL